ncbi:uncharacterized protein [Cebidichthys violaceus]
MTTEIHHRLDPTKQTDLHLRKIFEDLKKETCGTKTITAAFRIQNVYKQRDAAEILEMILREISPEASKVFKGALKRTTKCSKGHKIIEETNSFWTLPLSLNDSHDSSYSVESSFERIFQSKSFKGGNMVYCNDCEEKTEAETGCEMEVFPQILILLLKRFDDDNTGTYFKSHRCVDVSRELQRNNKKYELYAMVNHIGSLTGGHYTATILSNEDRTWYKFNDADVYKVEEQPFAETNSYNSTTVYLLMYRDAADAAPAAQTWGLWIFISSFFRSFLHAAQSWLNPMNWSWFHNNRLYNGITADDEEETKIRQTEEGLMGTGLKTGEEADADTIKNDKSVGETSNETNMTASENCAKQCEVESSGHEEVQEHLLTNGDGAHSRITQENTNNKLGELKQPEVDDAPVNDEEESDSRGQDLDEETEKPKQTATECQEPDERREREKREADDEEETKIRQTEEGLMGTGLKIGEEADADTIKNDKSVGETSNETNMTASENCAKQCEIESSGHEEVQEHLLTNGDGAHSRITQENTNSKLGDLKQPEVDDAPVNDEEESDSRGQDLDEETEKPKQTATEPIQEMRRERRKKKKKKRRRRR